VLGALPAVTQPPRLLGPPPTVSSVYGSSSYGGPACARVRAARVSAWPAKRPILSAKQLLYQVCGMELIQSLLQAPPGSTTRRPVSLPGSGGGQF
jgi:hypothetical protein